MLRSFRLGSAFGIDLYFHWTFLLLPAAIFFWHLREGETALGLYLALFVLVIFGCVLLHELGHALMARRFGIATRDITLYPIGGVARLARMGDSPWQEFWIAVAGPAVNVAIAALLAVVIAVVHGPLQLENLTRLSLGSFLVQLMAANSFLVLFNLLPAFPMDGGRVLRAVLGNWLPFLRATEIAAGLGVLMSVFFIFLGLVSVLPLFPNFAPMPMLILVGMFVLFAGQQELAAVRYRESRRWAEPLDVLPADEVLLPGMPPPHPRFSGFTWDSHARLWVQWSNGRPIHTISENSC
jgi:Zn-dependent protease